MPPRLHAPTSLRLRLALWYLLILGVTLALFSTMIFFDVRRSLLDGMDTVLMERAGTVASQVDFSNGVVSYPPDNDAPRAEAETAVYLFDARGRLRDKVAGSHLLPPYPPALWAPLHGHDGYSMSSGMRLYSLGLRDSQGHIVGVVQVVESVDRVRQQIARLLALLLISTPALLVLATLGGVFLAGRALAPIDRITRIAAAISAGNLTGRLSLEPRRDEVGRLAATFDRMLDRLEYAFARQRQFAADASHELRTPLTIIRGDLDVLLRRRRTPEEYEAAMRDVNDEVTRLSGLVEDLLTLARTDSGQVELAYELLALDALVVEVVEGMRRLAATRGVAVETRLAPDITLAGDVTRLRQLVANLLGNAIAYTPQGGRIAVTLRAEAAWACLEVADTGIGIAADDLPYIFDRFFRTNRARARDQDGVGLGLSIARWCVEAHGGRIEARSTPGAGSVFTVLLPLALSEEPAGQEQAQRAQSRLSPLPRPHGAQGNVAP